MLYSKCRCGSSLTVMRNICIYSALKINHYQVLGLNPSATQSEIKSAFYELSKKHHPDKNQGCEKSAKKFKDLTAAYEVLRNSKLREKYDREISSIRTTPFYNTSNSKADYNDEAERMFYEQTSRVKPRRFYGKTPYFDFDTWYESHYSNQSYSNFNQKQYQYNQYNNQYKHKFTKRNPSKSKSYGMYILSGGCVLLMTYSIFYQKKQ